MRGRETLVIRRGPGVRGSGYICAVSGHIEPGETETEAVVREVQEEVGLVVRPTRCVWACPSAAGDLELHWWLADYLAGQLALDPKEVSEAWWITPAQFAAFDSADTFADDRRFFAEVLPNLLEA
jgi:8-oxo-dGTP diphosphatase